MTTSRHTAFALSLSTTLLSVTSAFAQAAYPAAPPPSPAPAQPASPYAAQPASPYAAQPAPAPAPEVAPAPAPGAWQAAAPAAPVTAEPTVGPGWFGQRGTLAIGIERVFGFSLDSTTVESGTVKTTDKYTNISLLTGETNSAYNIPRVTVDYFVTDKLSLGAGLGYVHSSEKIKVEDSDSGTSAEADGMTVSGILLAPRVGYAHPFSEKVSIWPRAGITYVTASSDDGQGTKLTYTRTALSIEVPLVLTPIPNVGFLLGPSIDYGVSGTMEQTDTVDGVSTTASVDIDSLSFGVNFGLFAHF